MRSRLLLALAALAAIGLVAFLLSSGDDVLAPDRPAARSATEPVEPVYPEPPPAEGGEDEPAVGPGSGRIRVLVLREDDTPLPGAKVRAGMARAETDAAGSALLEGLQEGRMIPVRAEGPLPTDVAAEAKARAEVEPGKPLRLVIREGGSVTGAVTDEGGVPLGIAYRVNLRRLPDNIPDGIDISGLARFGGQAQASRPFPAGTSTFEMPGVEPGRYVASATAEGWVDGNSALFTVSRGAVTRDVAIPLTRGGSVSGVVLRASTGEPVKDAKVALSQNDGAMNIRMGGNMFFPGTHAGQTDDQGRFSLNGVKPGKYRLVATGTQLARGEIEEVLVEADRDTTGIVVGLGEGGSITGTVYDDAGQPVPGADVLIQFAQNTGITIIGDFGDRVKANDSGVYTAEHLEPGRYRVKRPSGGNGGAMVAMKVVGISGGGGGGQPEEPPDDGTTVLVREGQVSRFDVRSDAVARITGRLRDEAGKPVRERVQLVEVDVDEPTEPANTPRFRIPRFAMADAEGRFEFSGIATGTWRVVAGAASAEVTVGAGETREVELVLRETYVSGIVTDQAGRPAAGAMLRLRSLSREPGGMIMNAFTSGAKTDEAGRFKLDRVGAGEFRIEASKDGMKGRSDEFEVIEGQPVRDVRIRLESTTTVVFRVVNDAGEIVPGAFVSARTGTDFSGAARTDEKGEATLELLPGTYTVVANGISGGAARPQEKELVVGRGGTQRETLTVE